MQQHSESPIGFVDFVPRKGSKLHVSDGPAPRAAFGCLNNVVTLPVSISQITPTLFKGGTRKQQTADKQYVIQVEKNTVETEYINAEKALGKGMIR